MPPLENAAYTIGWICALPLEMVAARSMLDTSHGKPAEQHARDDNSYFLGSVGAHNVVIACTSSYGTVNAAVVAAKIPFSFPSVRFGLLVGIGGGVPNLTCDIRLGDVVVSRPCGTSGGVVRWDMGKALVGGEFHRTGFLSKPPLVLLNALAALEVEYELGLGLLDEYLGEAVVRNKSAKFRAEYAYQGTDHDKLYLPDYAHPEGGETCELCDEGMLVVRENRETLAPVVHYGTIASGDQVIKDARKRDEIAREIGALCFEMEAAGLMDNFPCLVIRGICDYADSHKNKRWQRYAAVAAAAFAKELLGQITLQGVDQTPTVAEVLKEDLRQIKQDIGGIKEVMTATSEEKTRSRIVNWIPANDYGFRYTKVLSERQEGTGGWFLESSEFCCWLSDETNMLFCPGIRGSGKTVLVSMVIEHLLHTYPSNKLAEHRTAVTFLYCDYKMPDQQDVPQLLSSMLKQLLQQTPVIPVEVKSLYERQSILDISMGLQEVKDAILWTLQGYDRTYLVVDALDECAEDVQVDLVSCIRELQESRQVKALITSRDIRRIVRQFEDDTILSIHAHAEDVQKYVEGNMARLPAFIASDIDLQEMVKTQIVQRTEGMFLLARLHLMLIKHQVSEKKVRLALKELPRGEGGLEDAYGSVMQRIEDQPLEYRKLAQRVLSWIVYAERMLGPSELRHALAVEEGAEDIDDTDAPDLDIMVSVCMGLVTVDLPSNTIRLIHVTTQEYLRGVGEPWVSSTSEDMAVTCIRYLSLQPFKSGPCQNIQALRARQAGYAFLKYAGAHWGHHARPVQTAIADTAVSFLMDRALVSSSIHVPFPSAVKAGVVKELPLEATGLHVAVWFDLPDILCRLLESGAVVDEVDSTNRTALHWATRLNHQDAVEGLLRGKADVERIDPVIDHSPLHLAISLGHTGLVRVLIRYGADIESQNSDGYNALHWACNCEDEEMVQILLDEGADVNAVLMRTTLASRSEKDGLSDEDACISGAENTQDEDGSNDEMSEYTPTALQIATISENLEIMRLLVCAGADVELCGRPGESPLSIAASSGCTNLVQYLIESGAKVDGGGYMDEPALTPLHWAATEGYLDVVQQLLDAKASINAISIDNIGGKTGMRVTALQLASAYGHDLVVRLLLDNGANPMLASEKKESPLYLALVGQHVDVVRTLLKTDLLDTDIQHFLHTAVQIDDTDVVKLVLEMSGLVDVGRSLFYALLSITSDNDTEDEMVPFLLKQGVPHNSTIEGFTALHVAAIRGHVKSVEALLSHGADISVTNEQGRTAVHLAASCRRLDVLWLFQNLGLLSPSIMEQRDEEGNTALHCAIGKTIDLPTRVVVEVSAEDEQLEVVKFLASEGADTNARTMTGEAPLHLLANIELPELILPLADLLIEYGANINVMDSDGCTSLHLAVKNCQDDLVAMLLYQEADTEIMNENGETALELAERLDFQGIVHALLSAGATGRQNQELHRLAQSECLRLAQELIERGDSIAPSMLEDMMCRAAEDGHDVLILYLLAHMRDDQYKASLETALHIAASYRRRGIVEHLVRCGVPVLDCTIEYFIQVGDHEMVHMLLSHSGAPSWSLLRLAVNSGNEQIVRYLLNSGAPMILRGPDGSIVDTAIHGAAGSGHVHVARLLLDHGGDLNATISSDGVSVTALEVAAASCQTAVMRLLLDRGALADQAVLNLAVESGDEAVVRTLLDYGVTVEINALCLAIKCAVEGLCDLLLKHVDDINTLNDTGYGPLHFAVVYWKSSIAKMLLNQKAKVDIQTSYEQETPNGLNIVAETPLHIAARVGNRDMAQILLQHGADIHALDDRGRTPLHLAASRDWYNGSIDQRGDFVLQLLLDWGADVHSRYGHRGTTALMRATSFGYDKGVRSLLKHGAVDSADARGMTSLHRAASSGHLGILQLLLEIGSDANSKDDNGRTALHLAVCNNEGGATKRLVAHHQTNSHATDNEGLTALHYASKKGHYQSIVALSLAPEFSSLVRLPTLDGVTALHLAVQGCFSTLVQFLLKHGADPNDADIDGWTALHYVASRDDYEMFEITWLLGEYGADPGLVDNMGFTPLDMLSQDDREGMLKMLQDAAVSARLGRGVRLVGDETREDRADEVEVRSEGNPQSESEESGSESEPAWQSRRRSI
ncbi:nucleoside phosphorylase domain-containing protein [Aspergillus flavus]|nr:nucleoside phosphorylase domain-containing protein [Aspergillus flavus]